MSSGEASKSALGVAVHMNISRSELNTRAAGRVDAIRKEVQKRIEVEGKDHKPARAASAEQVMELDCILHPT